MNLNKKQRKTRVSFLEEKPHVKGIINNIVFMLWDSVCFITGGNDHAVVLWTEKDGDNFWEPKVLHNSLHSSAVMGVAGMHQRQIVMSADWCHGLTWALKDALHSFFVFRVLFLDS
ncbi:hypothetical protein F0562_011748 [Nyssa sinensis]|uniref:Uncharacterized protein n=1 Tax=Nyssa sinensis TaxID=561372 RepID=A0A5J4ZSR0_9ASTE|nr:hypothetical protein F0562_011748 [Nyssa sinensis]